MKAYSNFIQVRAGKGTDKNKVFVKGYASIADKPDLHNYVRTPDGKTRTFKSLFTRACVEDMRKQLMNKQVFVDGMHETATNLGILSLAKKYNFDEEDLHNTEAYLKQKRLPLAKVVEFDMDDQGLVLGTETNPHFPMVDDEHKKYYEAVTGSLLDGYLKGYSINFDPVEFTTEVDSEGNEMDYINKVDLYGISYHDAPALPDNQFTEVCMRSLGNYMKVRTMTDKGEPKEPVEPKKAPQEPPQDKVEAEVQKRVQAELKKQAEAKDMDTMKQEIADQKKLIEGLQNAREEKPGEGKPVEPKPTDTSAQPQKQPVSIVPQQNKYAEPVDPAQVDDINKQAMEGLEEIKKPFDEYMTDVRRPTTDGDTGNGPRKVYGKSIHKTYGQVLELQREFELQKRPIPGESPRDYAQRQAILHDRRADMSISYRN